MKFPTLALAATLFAPVNSQTVTNGNFAFVGSYESESALGEYLGGGSIVDDTLLLQVQAEHDDAFIATVPVLRNPTTGRITGFDFASATSFFEHPFMEQLSQKANFAGDKYIYSAYSFIDDDTYTMNFADKTFTDITTIENIAFLGITDAATGEVFYGPAGVDFSPVITDPGTGIGKLMCTSFESFWEVALQLNVLTSEWEITDATKLAELDAYWAGGFSFIPSGTNKNNIFFADWDNDIVKMMKFDASGRPAPAGNPEITNFITGIEGAWGFFFDEKTNDFFVTTWGASTEGIVHFKGFPPGLDVDVVIANIQNEMGVALSILLSGRRKLEADADEPKRHRIREPAALKKKKKSKAGKSQADDDDGEVEIPTADEIVNDILSSGSSADATAFFTGLLDDTFSNDSFTNDVISGGASDAFTENIGKFSDSVDLLLTAADSANLDAADLVTVQDRLNTVNELVALLAGVTEGSAF